MELVMKTITMLLLIWKVFPSTQLKMKINQNLVLHPQQPLSESTPVSAFNIKTEVSKTTPTLGLVDIESIPFHPILNQDKSKTPTPTTDPVTQQTQSTATTKTVIGKAIVKPEPKHPHTKSKTCLPHLPTIPEKEPKEPETEIELKFQPEIPEFEPDFQLPNNPDSTTPEPSHPLIFQNFYLNH